MIRNYIRRNGNFRLSREFRNIISKKKNCKPLISEEREVDAVSAEYLRG